MSHSEHSRPRELRTRCNMRSIYGQSCKYASECYADIAVRALRGARVAEMKESRPSTRPSRLSQAVRDHEGAGQLDLRTVSSNANIHAHETWPAQRIRASHSGSRPRRQCRP